MLLNPQARLDELGVNRTQEGKPTNACFATHPSLDEVTVQAIIDTHRIPWHVVGSDEQGVHAVRLLPADVMELCSEINAFTSGHDGWLMSNGPALT